MAHGAILHGGHLLLLLIRKLAGVELGRVGHEGGRIHHGTGCVWVVYVREAIAIVVGDGVVCPGAHGVEPDRLCATASAISRHWTGVSLKGAGRKEDGAAARHARVVMVESRRGLVEE